MQHNSPATARLRLCAVAVSLACCAAVLAGCSRTASRGTGPTASPSAEPATDTVDDTATSAAPYEPNVDPAAFVDRIDNPFMPLTPGSRWIYEGESDGEAERTEVVVTPDRRLVMGVSTVVIRDTVRVAGEVVEDTYDWFAQDREGNVWYFGEEVSNFENGRVVNTSGSWEAGVDGAEPGIVMPAVPTPGQSFRQEYYAGEAEDMFDVVAVDATVSTPAGEFSNVVLTRDYTPLEPDVVEQKSYARGVGLVGEQKVEGGDGRTLLVTYTPGG